MGVLQRIVETVFCVLLVVGQAPTAAALWLVSLPMRAHDVLGPALCTLLWTATPRRPAGRNRAAHHPPAVETEGD